MSTPLWILLAFLLLAALVGLVPRRIIGHSVVTAMAGCAAIAGMLRFSGSSPEDGLYFSGLDYAAVVVGVIAAPLVSPITREWFASVRRRPKNGNQ